MFTRGALHSVGVDMGDVAVTLEHEGVAAFAKSFDELLATLEARSHELRSVPSGSDSLGSRDTDTTGSGPSRGGSL